MPIYARYPSLATRTVLVTGGATGIGATLAAQFTAQSARVAFIDINEPAGHARAAALLLFGLASGIALFDLEREALTPIVPVEPEQPRTRINDGRCDAQGRFVFGMFDQAARSEPTGHFYRVDSDLSVDRSSR